MKTNIFQITLLVIAIIVGGILIKHSRSQMHYIDIDCPYCGASEAIDFGINDNGQQCVRCIGCSSEYTFINQ